mgnify:CR=1 FL=1
MQLLSTKALAITIPPRSMIDLEEMGGEGFHRAYATLVDVSPDGRLLIAQHEGSLHSFVLEPGTTIPVITYSASNTLERTNPS